MMRFTALNDTQNSENDSVCHLPTSTKEAKESEAFTQYSHALHLQERGLTEQAYTEFTRLLEHTFLQEASKQAAEEDDSKSVHPGHKLLYSVHKILAYISLRKGDKPAALDSFIKASEVDATEVTVWYKIGCLAMDQHNYPLSRYAFYQSLKLNPHHWPCLDSIITVFYVLNDYYNCLLFVSRALEMDPQYERGHILRRLMYKEDPSLKRDTQHMFARCDSAIYDVRVPVDVINKCAHELQDRRQARRDLAIVADPALVCLARPLSYLTWLDVGQNFLCLYDDLTETDPPKQSLCIKVDLGTLPSKLDPPFAALNNSGAVTTTTDSSDSIPVVADAKDGDVAMETISVAPDQESVVNDDAPCQVACDENASIVDTRVDSPLTFDSMDASQSGTRRGAKRKRTTILLDDPGGKRRSARVRNTTQKKQDESINFRALLQTFLPSTLVRRNADDGDAVLAETSTIPDQNDATSHAYKDNEPVEKIDKTETCDVQSFLEQQRDNSGIISLMLEYLFQLSDRQQKLWYEGLPNLFMEIYRRIRKHIIFPSYYDSEGKETFISKLSKVSLLHGEFLMDCRASNNSSLDQKKSDTNKHDCDLGGQYLSSDLHYLASLSKFPSIIGNFIHEHRVRVAWLKARIHSSSNEINRAEMCYATLLELFEDTPISVHLINCQMDNLIDAETVSKQAECLQRCVDMDEVKADFDGRRYDKVAESIKKTFIPLDKSHFRVHGPSAPTDRPEQLMMLLESYQHLGQPQACMFWGEKCVNEGVLYHRHAPTSLAREQWANCLVDLCSLLFSALMKTNEAFADFDSTNLSRMVYNIISVIEINLDTSDSVVDMPVSTVVPWVLLYSIVKHEESKIEALMSEEEARSVRCGMSNSLMFLNVSHDHLGRRGWCTHSDGLFLTFTMDIIKSETARLKSDVSHHKLAKTVVRPIKEELSQAFEQCTYCLYGFPSRKSRTKNIVDHSSNQTAGDLFKHFKPKVLPEFDGYKTSTVSSEFESLLTRIFDLMPERYKPVATIELLKAYIDGTVEDLPEQPHTKVSHVTKDLFYLLADYNFKNTEPSKAIDFYLMDLSINLARVDSWAGLALAYMSRLEQEKLNSNELRITADMTGPSTPTLRCFKHAVTLDAHNSNLWIEYGSITYQLHSFASRQHQMRDWFTFATDAAQIEATKTAMLDTAYDCYVRASQCDAVNEHSEEWLNHYMMGKIKEKTAATLEALAHYKQAAEFIHKDHAVYPKKITYVVSPPHLAVEAVEMYYRVHACVLKSLLQNDAPAPDYNKLETYIREAKTWPFVLQSEKSRAESDTPNVTSACKELTGSSCFTKNPLKRSLSLSSVKTEAQDNTPHTPIVLLSEPFAVVDDAMDDKHRGVSPAGKKLKTFMMADILGDENSEDSEPGNEMNGSNIPKSRETSSLHKNQEVYDEARVVERSENIQEESLGKNNDVNVKLDDCSLSEVLVFPGDNSKIAQMDDEVDDMKESTGDNRSDGGVMPYDVVKQNTESFDVFIDEDHERVGSDAFVTRDIDLFSEVYSRKYERSEDIPKSHKNQALTDLAENSLLIEIKDLINLILQKIEGNESSVSEKWFEGNVVNQNVTTYGSLSMEIDDSLCSSSQDDSTLFSKVDYQVLQDGSCSVDQYSSSNISSQQSGVVMVLDELESQDSDVGGAFCLGRSCSPKNLPVQSKAGSQDSVASCSVDNNDVTVTSVSLVHSGSSETSAPSEENKENRLSSEQSGRSLVLNEPTEESLLSSPSPQMDLVLSEPSEEGLMANPSCNISLVPSGPSEASLMASQPSDFVVSEACTSELHVEHNELEKHTQDLEENSLVRHEKISDRDSVIDCPSSELDVVSTGSPFGECHVGTASEKKVDIFSNSLAVGKQDEFVTTRVHIESDDVSRTSAVSGGSESGLNTTDRSGLKHSFHLPTSVSNITGGYLEGDEPQAFKYDSNSINVKITSLVDESFIGTDNGNQVAVDVFANVSDNTTNVNVHHSKGGTEERNEGELEDVMRDSVCGVVDVDRSSKSRDSLADDDVPGESLPQLAWQQNVIIAKEAPPIVEDGCKGVVGDSETRKSITEHILDYGMTGACVRIDSSSEHDDGALIDEPMNVQKENKGNKNQFSRIEGSFVDVKSPESSQVDSNAEQCVGIEVTECDAVVSDGAGDDKTEDEERIIAGSEPGMKDNMTAFSEALNKEKGCYVGATESSADSCSDQGIAGIASMEYGPTTFRADHGVAESKLLKCEVPDEAMEIGSNRGDERDVDGGRCDAELLRAVRVEQLFNTGEVVSPDPVGVGRMKDNVTIGGQVQACGTDSDMCSSDVLMGDTVWKGDMSDSVLSIGDNRERSGLEIGVEEKVELLNSEKKMDNVPANNVNDKVKIVVSSLEKSVDGMEIKEIVDHTDTIEHTNMDRGNLENSVVIKDDLASNEKVDQRSITEKFVTIKDDTDSDDKVGQITCTENSVIVKDDLSENAQSVSGIKCGSDGNGDKSLSDPERKRRLLDWCETGISLCLSRFPQHYKSQKRLAQLYFLSDSHRNVTRAREMFLGYDAAVPAMFSIRKTNFFQGIWRIPSAEIDRNGSFATHMCRSVTLLLDILRDLNDYNTLLDVHKQLSRSPDSGRKYIRDAERVFLASRAFEYCVEAASGNIITMKTADDAARRCFLLDCYKIWNHSANRVPKMLDLSVLVLGKAYHLVTGREVRSKSDLEEAVGFCRSAHLNPSIHHVSLPSAMGTKPTPQPPQITSTSFGKAGLPLSLPSSGVTAIKPPQLDSPIVKPCQVLLHQIRITSPLPVIQPNNQSGISVTATQISKNTATAEKDKCSIPTVSLSVDTGNTVNLQSKKQAVPIPEKFTNPPLPKHKNSKNAAVIVTNDDMPLDMTTSRSLSSNSTIKKAQENLSSAFQLEFLKALSSDRSLSHISVGEAVKLRNMASNDGSPNRRVKHQPPSTKHIKGSNTQIASSQVSASISTGINPTTTSILYLSQISPVSTNRSSHSTSSFIQRPQSSISLLKDGAKQPQTFPRPPAPPKNLTQLTKLSDSPVLVASNFTARPRSSCSGYSSRPRIPSSLPITSTPRVPTFHTQPTVQFRSPRPGQPNPSFKSSRLRSPTANLRSPTPNLRSPTPNLRPRTPNLRPQTPNLRSPTPNLRSSTPNLRSPPPTLSSPTPHLRSPTPHLRSPTSNLRSPTPNIRSPTSSFRSQTPNRKSQTTNLQPPHRVTPLPTVRSRLQGVLTHSQPPMQQNFRGRRLPLHPKTSDINVPTRTLVHQRPRIPIPENHSRLMTPTTSPRQQTSPRSSIRFQVSNQRLKSTSEPNLNNRGLPLHSQHSQTVHPKKSVASVTVPPTPTRRDVSETLQQPTLSPVQRRTEVTRPGHGIPHRFFDSPPYPIHLISSSPEIGSVRTPDFITIESSTSSNDECDTSDDVFMEK